VFEDKIDAEVFYHVDAADALDTIERWESSLLTTSRGLAANVIQADPPHPKEASQEYDRRHD